MSRPMEVIVGEATVAAIKSKISIYQAVAG